MYKDGPQILLLTQVSGFSIGADTVGKYGKGL